MVKIEAFCLDNNEYNCYNEYGLKHKNDALSIYTKSVKNIY